MKRALALLALGMFITAGVVGCEASAKVGDSDTSTGSYSKKTTSVQEPNGDREVKTEVKRTN